MIDQVDIQRAAFGVMRAYGEEAETECSQLIERWEKRGDQEAVHLWRSVLKVVRQKKLGDKANL